MADPLVAVIMGSTSDLETMQNAVDVLDQFDIPNETSIVSAHRTPDRMFRFAEEAAGRVARRICLAWWRPRPSFP